MKVFRDYFFIRIAILFSWLTNWDGKPLLTISDRRDGGFWPSWVFWIFAYIWPMLCHLQSSYGMEVKSQNAYHSCIYSKLTISAYSINYITPLAMGSEHIKRSNLNPIWEHTKPFFCSALCDDALCLAFFFWMISVPLFLLIIPKIPPGVQIILWNDLGNILLIYWAFTVYTKGHYT